MVRLFLYRELSGESSRALTQSPELTDAFGLEKNPDESVVPRTWRNCFDDATREFVTTAAHYVVKEVHHHDINVPETRPKAEVVTPDRDPSAFSDERDEDELLEFTPKQIQRTTRLVRDRCFEGPILVVAQTPPTIIHSCSSYRRSWGWSPVGRPKAPTAFSTDTARRPFHIVIRISERSNSSSPRYY
jgi:hypothetical protein